MEEHHDIQSEHSRFIDSLGDWSRTHSCGALSSADMDSKVCLFGWVQFRRDHGGLIFIDLRDKHGLTQVVFSPEVDADSHEKAHILRTEYVLAIKGVVRSRPEGMVNTNLPTGEIEVVVHEWKLLNTSKTPPFLIEDRVEASENLRLQYRYMDLRRSRLNSNLILRHKASQSIRRFLDSKDFLEIETPILTKSTPEGARDFIVPSRLNTGSFYALPQSPQLFKQLLMMSGFDRYYQIVRCFRDEDLRADRQPEFTQIDMELSFIHQEDIIAVTEDMLSTLFKDTLGIDLPRPFPRMDYDRAIADYGLDKPDTRFELYLKDVTSVVKNSEFKVFSKAELVKGLRIPGGAVLTRKEIDDLTDFVKIYGAQGLAWIKIKENEWQSPFAKFLSETEKDGLKSDLHLEVGDIVFFQAGAPEMVNSSLGNLRAKMAQRFDLIPKDSFSFTWVVDFPMFEWDAEEKRWVARHHPFTHPKDEHLDFLFDKPEAVKAKSYDLVLNGFEIGGGSIRIHRTDLQQAMFKALGIEEQEAEDKFGFLLEALRYGAPPHGGIAFGFDRLLMIMAGTASIRDVIAFPKTQKGTCLMTGAPDSIPSKILREVGIRVRDGKQ